MALTTDRLRSDIDRGRSGDKVSAPDFAAVPLGTDAEAAGFSPTQTEIAMASQPLDRGRARGRRRSIEGFAWLYLALALPVAIAVFGAAFLGLSGPS